MMQVSQREEKMKQGFTRGMIVLTLLAVVWGGGGPATASPILINFEADISAPALFRHTTRLTTLYAHLGVHFVGPGGNDGGAILHHLPRR